MDTSTLPSSAAAVNGDALANSTVSVKITATNTGTVAGDTAIMAVYTKQTRGVVRNLRDLCGFTKIHLKPGQSTTVEIMVRLADLGEHNVSPFRQKALWSDLLEQCLSVF